MGALQLVAGHFGLALDSARLSAAASPGLGIFYASLALIATGVGFLKTNASTLVRALSQRDDPRRDAGFTLFYMGYNTGAVIAPLVCVSERVADRGRPGEGPQRAHKCLIQMARPAGFEPATTGLEGRCSIP